MSIVKFNRNRAFPTAFGDWDTMMNSLFASEYPHSRFSPSVNVSESDSAYKLELAAPGRSKNDFQVSVDNDMLTIHYEKEQKNDESNEKFTRKEFSISKFERSFTLPEIADVEKIDATYTDGILTVSIPKKEDSKKPAAKNIKVS